MTITLATNNAHKLEELTSIVQHELGDRVTIQTLAQAGIEIEIEETGTTLEENALIKARAIHAITHGAVLADDTGLEVAALGGAPGVYSARYAGEHASYMDNVNKLLGAMRDVASRDAMFRTVIAFIDVNGDEHLFSGEVLGTIASVPRGTAGFGYDPIFLPTEAKARTFAELSAEEKNAISHRGRALRAFTDFLQRREF